LLIAVIISFCGCATTRIGLAPVDVNQDAKTLTPPPGKGRVYILLPKGMFNFSIVHLYNSQGVRADITTSTFIKWDLDPGVIVIYDPTPQLFKPIVFEAFHITEGQVLFLQWEWRFEDIAGVGWVWRIFQPVSIGEVLERIQFLNMSLNKESDKRDYFEWSSAATPVKGQKLGQGFYCRANAYFKGRKFDEAIADYSKAIELNPKLSNLARLMRSLAYMCSGQMGKAESDYQQVVDKSRVMKVMATYLRAVTYDRDGNYSDAITYYQIFLKLIQRKGRDKVINQVVYALSFTAGVASRAPLGGVLIGAAVTGGKENEDVVISGMPGESVADLEALGYQVENRIKKLQEITNRRQP
jgi:tetratricopeptide (TPR) repeat protein